MKRGFWFWMLLALGLIFGAFYLASGDIGIYSDLPSLFISVIMAFLISFTSSSPREIAAYIRQSRETSDLDPVVAKQGISYFKMLQGLVISLGILGSFIGTVAMLRNLTEKDMVAIGFSVAILTTLYSIAFSLIFTQPFIGALKKKLLLKK